jgi:N-methylhydantoinase A
MTVEQFAAGVVRVVNANMEKAIRVVSIERGYDPREFTLVAFGGAGGMHACELAAALSIPRVLVPARPGALSAYGILASDVVKDYSRTVLWRVCDRLPMLELRRVFGELRKNAERDFRAEGWLGRILFDRSVDVRYRGQGYELNVPGGKGLLESFHEEHRRRYGYSHAGRDVEIVTLRLRASIRSPIVPRGSARRGRVAPSLADRADVVFDGRRLATTVCERDALRPGKRYTGPAVVTEYSATTVIPPGMRFYADWSGNLMVEIRGR